MEGGGVLVDRLRYTLGLDTRDMDKGAKRAEGSLKKVGAGISRFKAIVATVIAGIAAHVAISAAKMAGEIEGLEKGFKRLCQNYSASADSILSDLRRIARGTMSTADIIRSANTAMLLSIPAENLAKMMEIAMAASVTTGQKAGFMFESISLGIGRQSRLILDNLGIIVRQEEVYRKASQRLGRELSETEKKQEFLNEVMRAGARIIRTAGSNSLTAAQRMQKLTASLENAKAAIGRIIAAPLAKFFENMARLIEDTVEALEQLNETDLERLIKQMKELGLSVEETSEYETIARIERLTKEIERLSEVEIKLPKTPKASEWATTLAGLKEVWDKIQAVSEIFEKMGNWMFPTPEPAGVLNFLKKCKDAVKTLKDWTKEQALEMGGLFGFTTPALRESKDNLNALIDWTKGQVQEMAGLFDLPTPARREPTVTGKEHKTALKELKEWMKEQEKSAKGDIAIKTKREKLTEKYKETLLTLGKMERGIIGATKKQIKEQEILVKIQQSMVGYLNEEIKRRSAIKTLEMEVVRARLGIKELLPFKPEVETEDWMKQMAEREEEYKNRYIRDEKERVKIAKTAAREIYDADLALYERRKGDIEKTAERNRKVLEDQLRIAKEMKQTQIEYEDASGKRMISLEEYQTKEREKLQQNYQENIAGVKENEIRSERILESRILEIDQEAYEKRLAELDAALKEVTELYQKATVDQYEFDIKQAEKRRATIADVLKRSYEQGMISEQKYEDSITQLKKATEKEIIEINKNALEEQLSNQRAFTQAVEALMLSRFEQERMQIQRQVEEWEQQGIKFAEIEGKKVTIAEWRAAAIADIDKRQRKETENAEEEERSQSRETWRFLIDIDKMELKNYQKKLQNQLALLKKQGKDKTKEYQRIQKELEDIALSPIVHKIKLLFQGDVSEVKSATDLATVAFGRLVKELSKTDEEAGRFISTIGSMAIALADKSPWEAAAIGFMAVVDALFGAEEAAKSVAERQLEAARNAKDAAEAIKEFTRDIKDMALAEQREKYAFMHAIVKGWEKITHFKLTPAEVLRLEEMGFAPTEVPGFEDVYSFTAAEREAFRQAVEDLRENIERLSAPTTWDTSTFRGAIAELEHDTAVLGLDLQTQYNRLMEIARRFGVVIDETTGDLVGMGDQLVESEFWDLERKIAEMRRGLEEETGRAVAESGSQAYRATTRITESQANLMNAVLNSISAVLRGGISEKLAGILRENLKHTALLGVGLKGVIPEIPVQAAGGNKFYINVDGTIDPALAEQLGRDIGESVDDLLRARGM